MKKIVFGVMMFSASCLFSQGAQSYQNMSVLEYASLPNVEMLKKRLFVNKKSAAYKVDPDKILFVEDYKKLDDFTESWFYQIRKSVKKEKSGRVLLTQKYQIFITKKDGEIATREVFKECVIVFLKK